MTRIFRRKLKARRHFMTQAFASVAAISTAPAWAVDMTPKKLRVGVVGGRFGLGFQFHEHLDCVVQAVSDLRPERRDRLMKKYKCEKSYPSLEEMVLAKDIDAVAIFTDGTLHVDHVEKTMKNGKHALSAVPAAANSIEDAEKLLAIVKKFGLTYMMAETSYYMPYTIAARQMFKDGAFGEVYHSSAFYQHDGVEPLWIENGKPTWRYGFAPMCYPTHTIAHLLSVTGERLTEVTCRGWGDDSPILKNNVYRNPFWNESASFKTNRGHAFDARIWWKGAHQGGEHGEWIGTKSSLYSPVFQGDSGKLVRRTAAVEKEAGGYTQSKATVEKYNPPEFWNSEVLPKSLRHKSDHDNSHPFLTHEFVDAIQKGRQPTIDVYEALAYTVPGIVAHQSALKGGECLKIPQYDRPKK